MQATRNALAISWAASYGWINPSWVPNGPMGPVGLGNCAGANGDGCLIGCDPNFTGNPKCANGSSGEGWNQDGYKACWHLGRNGTTCPANSTQSGNNCTCAAGYSETVTGDGSTICEVAPDPCLGNTGPARKTFFSGYDPGVTGVATHQITSIPTGAVISQGGCGFTVQYPGNFYCYTVGAAVTKLYCDVDTIGTGSAAPGGSHASAVPDNANPCPSGFSYGTVNNIPRCLSSGAASSQVGVPSQVTSGSVTGTVVNNNNTTTTTINASSNNGTVQTVTTIIRNSTTGIELSRTEDVTRAELPKTEQAKFCESNPNSPMCKNSTFSGNCAGGVPSCDGDAAQCATARAVYLINCEIRAPIVTITALGETLLAGNDPIAAILPTPANADFLDMSAAILTTPFLSGACPGDETFSILGQDIKVPWSKWCPVLDVMGYVTLILASLSCAVIIRGGIG